MSQSIAEIEKCGACGVDVREGTQFCYNCGQQVVSVDAGSDRLAEIEAAYETSAPAASDGNRVRAAADKRKKSRLAKQQSEEKAWSPPRDDSNSIYLIFGVVIFVVSALIVAFTMWSR